MATRGTLLDSNRFNVKFIGYKFMIYLVITHLLKDKKAIYSELVEYTRGKIHYFGHNKQGQLLHFLKESMCCLMLPIKNKKTVTNHIQWMHAND